MGVHGFLHGSFVPAGDIRIARHACGHSRRRVMAPAQLLSLARDVGVLVGSVQIASLVVCHLENAVVRLAAFVAGVGTTVKAGGPRPWRMVSVDG